MRIPFIKYWILLALFFIGLTITAIHPKDVFTYCLEVFPAIIGLFILLFTFKKFRFTYLVYVFILLHCYILFIGGHYTYAEVPLFNWIRDHFGLARNNYDKVGHFMQGFVPALIIREVLIRRQVIIHKRWRAFVVTCICLSISAAYEFLEWFVALLSGEAGDAFLGTQGYIWDTQSDMLFATIGAILAQVFLGKIHNTSIAKIS